MSMKRRKVPEMITISECTDSNSDSDRPGWLPDGWERVSRWKNNQNISFYYPCPKCAGITLQTQDEVLRHCLFLCEDAPLKSKAFFQNEQGQETPRHPQPVRHTNELPLLKDGRKSGSSEEGGQFGNGLFDSIPCGWIIEIRRGPGEYGKIYKFYVDPTKEYRFSSKEEVQFYLKEGKPLYPASTEILYCDTKGENNIIAEITYSPENLPYGWIKEIKYRHNYATSKNGIRKDPYYTDPESGIVFRSHKEVERYLQTGEVPKQARVPQRSIADFYSFESFVEMPEYLARRFYSPKRGRPSKRSIDNGDDNDNNEEDNKVLMRPTDDASLKTRDEFTEGGIEHEYHLEVAAKTEIVGPNGTIFAGEQDQTKEGDPTRVQLSNVDRLTV